MLWSRRSPFLCSNVPHTLVLVLGCTDVLCMPRSSGFAILVSLPFFFIMMNIHEWLKPTNLYCTHPFCPPPLTNPSALYFLIGRCCMFGNFSPSHFWLGYHLKVFSSGGTVPFGVLFVSLSQCSTT